MTYVELEVREGLQYLTAKGSTPITEEMLDEYFYKILFSNVEFIEKNITRDVFVKNFFVYGGQIDLYEGCFLYNFVKSVKPNKIMEFSSARGHTTVFIAKAVIDSGAKIEYFHTHEIDPVCVNAAEVLLYENDIDCVTIKEGDVFQTLDRDKLRDADFLFIDSDHEKEFCERYAKEFLPLLKSGCWVGVHDIRLNKSYVNDESLIIKDFVQKNNIKNYFLLTDVLKCLKMSNSFRPWPDNPSFYFQR